MDAEVMRLRQLRAVALKVRAIARELGRGAQVRQDPCCEAIACAAWRVVRAVNGRLRGHPYAPFQRDVGLSALIANGMIAAAVGFRSTPRRATLQRLDPYVKRLARELDDARALTWAADFSDSLGRSQAEIRRLQGALPGLRRGGEKMAGPEPALAAPAPAMDWPYLAL